MHNDSKSQMGFAQRRLPWIIAAVFLLVYLVTLVNWGTIPGLPPLAKAAGWDWRPTFHAPLLYLFTLPVRWLPAGWQLTGLNVMGALCAAASLGLLARSVALLPQDRTKQQRQLERSDYSYLSSPTAWLPPVLAAVLCGLQLTFWENAILFTGESLDLLIFAFVVWNLIEFRIDERPWRLPAAAFVFGAGMTNNFAMIAFFPVFLVAVVWIKGMPFFNVRFLLAMLAAGVAGLLFYLVQPAVVVSSDLTHHTFWDALLVNWGYQKSNIAGFPRYLILITGLTSIAPVLFMGIRWPAQFGDTNPVGARLTTLMTHLIHAVFLVACIYVAFDPPFSPRHLGGGFAFLPFYFLGALSAGYFAGYFLLICGTMPQKSWEKPSPLVAMLNQVVVKSLLAGVAVVSVALAVKNYPRLDIKTAPELDYLAEAAVAALPDGPAVVVSDDSMRLYALEAALNRAKPGHEYVLVDTASLPLAGYHRAQARRYETRWPDPFVERSLVKRLPEVELQEFVVNLAKSQPLFYLHHSFGYYFEALYAHPHQSLFELKPLPPNQFLAPAPAPPRLAEAEAFWDDYFERQLGPLLERVARNQNKKDPDPYTSYLAGIHSVALNALGVAEQRTGRLTAASNLFHRALLLSPDSPSAFINQDFNHYLRNPQGPIPAPSEGALQRLEKSGREWNSILNRFGPVDEPNTCYLLAQVFIRGNNFVQGVQELTRSLELNPGFYPAHLALANAWIQLREVPRAMAEIQKVKSSKNAGEFTADTKLSILELEAWAKTIVNETDQAVALLKNAQREYPDKNLPFSTLANIYVRQGQYTNAIQVYLDQLQAQPANVAAMVNLSAIKIRYTGEMQDAIERLGHALQIEPKNKGALINRAIAYLNLSQLQEAKEDYMRLKSLHANPVAAVEYGLAEVYWKETDYPKAREHYEAFLEIAPGDSREAETAAQRIRDIRSGNL